MSKLGLWCINYFFGYHYLRFKVISAQVTGSISFGINMHMVNGQYQTAIFTNIDNICEFMCDLVDDDYRLRSCKSIEVFDYVTCRVLVIFIVEYNPETQRFRCKPICV